MKLNNQSSVDIFRSEIIELEKEHKNLEMLLADTLTCNRLTDFAVQRIKRRKLKLKERILQLKNYLQPDIIA